MEKNFFAINYFGIGIKTSNYSDPLEKYPTSYFTTASAGVSKDLQVRMVDQEIQTQSSPFGYVKPDILPFTSVSNIVSDISEIKEGTQTVTTSINLSIRMNQELIITNRAYKTIFQYLAELGGLFNVIKILSVILIFRVAATFLMVDFVSVATQKNIVFQQSLTALESFRQSFSLQRHYHEKQSIQGEEPWQQTDKKANNLDKEAEWVVSEKHLQEKPGGVFKKSPVRFSTVGPKNSIVQKQVPYLKKDESQKAKSSSEEFNGYPNEQQTSQQPIASKIEVVSQIDSPIEQNLLKSDSQTEKQQQKLFNSKKIFPQTGTSNHYSPNEPARRVKPLVQLQQNPPKVSNTSVFTFSFLPFCKRKKSTLNQIKNV